MKTLVVVVLFSALIVLAQACEEQKLSFCLAGPGTDACMLVPRDAGADLSDAGGDGDASEDGAD